jgi:hypothetical protein
MLGQPQGHGAAERKIPLTPSGIKPATFQLVVQCLNQLRYRHGNWIVVPSLLGFGRLRFLFEEHIYLVAATAYRRKMPQNSGPELLEEY